MRLLAATLVLASLSASMPVVAQEPLTVSPLAEKRLATLPAGPLTWRIEVFGSKAEADRAAGPTGLAVETAGKHWLFTLGHGGDGSRGGTKVAEVGPIPDVKASEYLLRVNEAKGRPGSITQIHTHPGSEAFYVLSGEMSQRTAHGTTRVASGQTMAGHGAGVAMQVSSSGATDLHSLVMFVVDASKPFSSPATMP